MLLCRTHHRLVHEAGYDVQKIADKGVVFSLLDGKIIPQGPDIRSRGNVVSIKIKNRRNGLKITPKTSIPNWHGEQMDNGVAVDMLLECE